MIARNVRESLKKKIGLTNAKQEKVALISYLSHNLKKVFQVLHVLLAFFTHVSAQNVQSGNSECAKGFTFRKWDVRKCCFPVGSENSIRSDGIFQTLL